MLVALAPGSFEIVLHLGFESLGEHPARSLTGDLIEVEHKLLAILVVVVYRSHRCTLPFSPNSRGRYTTFLRESSIHNFRTYLPKKSPWLNPLEPKWVHGKRRVVEADGLLTAYELAERACAAFGCPHYEHLSLAENVA
jgi:hypothetical protein